MDKIRVVVVDDHEMVRYGLHGILDAEPDMVVVGEAASGEDALRVARELEPDVLLLDVKLADMDGPEVCRRVLAVSPRINVVMLTSYTQEAIILQSLAAGARGYIVKDIELGALKDAIRSVHRGHTVLDPKITGSLVARMTGRAPHSDPRQPMRCRPPPSRSWKCRSSSICPKATRSGRLRSASTSAPTRSRTGWRRSAPSSRRDHGRGSWPRR